MKNALILFLFSLTFLVRSQAPQYINYQAIARDGSGNIVTTPIGIKFQIYQGSLSGTLVYEETHTSTPSSAGIFTVHIGGGTPVTGTFSSIAWGSGPFFLQVNIDPAGGTSYTTLGASQLVSVPYALFAEKAGNAASYTAGNGIAINSGSIINTSPNQTVNITGAGVSGTYPNYTVSASSYSAGTGISVVSGSITNTAPDQTVNLNAAGITTVTSAYPNFTVDVAPPNLTYNSSTKELTINQGGTSSTATLTGTGSNTISMVGTGIASVTPTGAGSNFTVNVQSPVITGQGATSVLGAWPNFTVTTPAATNYVAGSGINIAGNTITNSSPDQTVTLAGAGNSTVSGTYPNFTVSSSSTTYTAGSGISLTGNIITNTVPDQTVTISGIGSATVGGTYPNFTISTPVATITPPPTITGAGITTVTSVGPNYTVNTPPVNMTYLPGTGVLSYSQAIGTNTINLSPALTFTNGTLGVGSNTVTIPGSGLWSRPTNSATILSNTLDFVGIGINAPTTRLHLSDTSASTNLSGFSSAPRTSLRIHNNDLTTNNFSSLIFSTINSGSAHFEAAKIAAVNTNHTNGSQSADLAFLTRNPGNLFERMRLTSFGYLGLGTTSPAQLLHMYSSGTNIGIAIDAGTAGRARLGILAGGVDNGEIGYTNHLTFGSISNSSLVMSTEWMRLTSNGNLGIGTISPANKLHVNGGVTITDGTQGANKVLTSDAAGNASWQLGPPKIAFNAGTNTVSNQAVLASTTATVQFGAGVTFFNDGGGYNTTTYLFTPPSAGVYNLSTYLTVQGSTGSTVQVMIRCPAGQVARCNMIMGSTTAVISLNTTVNTTVQSGPYWVTVFSTAAIQIQPYDSSFSGFKAY